MMLMMYQLGLQPYFIKGRELSQQARRKTRARGLESVRQLLKEKKKKKGSKALHPSLHETRLEEQQSTL